MSEAVIKINAGTSDFAYYTISLQENIECGSLSFSRNTTTILGNGHTLTFEHYDGAIHVGSETTTPPVLILGGAQDTLTIEGASTTDTYFIGVGAINGGTKYGTLKMCGGVTVINGGEFTMTGGEIKNNSADGWEDHSVGGGFSVEADLNATSSTVVAFNESCAVYVNTALSGADDFYKNGNSTVNALPTAAQMSAAAKNAVISGWYKDEEGNTTARTMRLNILRWIPPPMPCS